MKIMVTWPEPSLFIVHNVKAIKTDTRALVLIHGIISKKSYINKSSASPLNISPNMSKNMDSSTLLDSY